MAEYSVKIGGCVKKCLTGRHDARRLLWRAADFREQAQIGVYSVHKTSGFRRRVAAHSSSSRSGIFQHGTARERSCPGVGQGAWYSENG